MRLISFVGTGPYQEVAYALHPDGPRVRTRFITEALAQLLRPDQVSLLLTEKAAGHENRHALQARLQELGFSVEPVPIPDGRSQAELWELFRQVGALAATGEPLALDLTHAFRSLPAVALLSAGYFQALGRLRLQGLYYGAFEARDQEGRAPIFDLTAMLALPAWALAARSWQEQANASALRDSTRAANAQAWGEGAARPRWLAGLADALDAFSGNLALARHDLADQAAQLGRCLRHGAEEVASHAPPLAPLLAQAAAPLLPLQQSGLAGELALVRWQLESGHILAAALLAREWLVSYWMHTQALADRDSAEQALGALAQLHDGSQPGALWDELGKLRNDLAHCGHNLAPAAARRIPARLAQYVAELAELHRKLAKP